MLGGLRGRTMMPSKPLSCQHSCSVPSQLHHKQDHLLEQGSATSAWLVQRGQSLTMPEKRHQWSPCAPACCWVPRSLQRQTRSSGTRLVQQSCRRDFMCNMQGPTTVSTINRVCAGYLSTPTQGCLRHSARCWRRGGSSQTRTKTQRSTAETGCTLHWHPAKGIVQSNGAMVACSIRRETFHVLHYRSRILLIV